MQHDLFVTLPEQNRENVQEKVDAVAKRLSDNHLLKPDFQREFVWSDDQIAGWAQTIIDNNAIGVIVTYQISGGGPIYLADGLQRLTATQRFIEAPQKYGFNFGPEQATVYCKNFSITVQHRVYKSHLDAMRAFQRLNSGTSLTLAEFYLGELNLDARGKLVSNKVPEIVRRYEYPYFNGREIKALSLSKMNRDALALFLQYVSERKESSFWDVATSKIRKGHAVVESELMKFINTHEWDTKDVEEKLKLFDNIVSRHFSELSGLLSETGQTGKALSPTFSRTLLHLRIWVINSKIPFQRYQDFVRKLLDLVKPYSSATSRVSVTRDGKIIPVTLNIDRLDKVRILDSFFHSNLFDEKRERKSSPARGYHNSHVQPFATHGNGETFIESASRNMSRGAKPIESV